MGDFFERIAALRQERQAFALATVVSRKAPVSAHLGDRAIVYGDGRMEGFVGGACSREIVRQQALEAMQARCSRLVSIRPDASDAHASTSDHVVVPMTCASEGAIDVFVEPFVQPRRLVVVGATPVADALARVAHSMEYDVVRVVDKREEADTAAAAAPLGIAVVTLDGLGSALQSGGVDQAVVVASQGHYDEEALESILELDVAYVGLVASAKRGAAVKALLQQDGARSVDSIRHPAGLDLGARTPPEIALSILAEIVKKQPTGSRVEVRTATAPAVNAVVTPRTAVDPVCGMRVDVAAARHTAELDGVTYYFCCPHCRAHFLNDPKSFQVSAS
jgi:xanthine dehydrogenase accessory factor